VVMRQRLQRVNLWFDAHLQRVSDKSLEWLINMNGYHVAAVFLLLLLIGSATEPNNLVLKAISIRSPLLTPLFWNCTFALCAFVMTRNIQGKYEDIIAYLFFILPVSVFFYFLLTLTLGNNSQPTPYFIVMLIIACVFMIDMYVARTRVINYFKTMVVQQRETIARMTEKLEALEGTRKQEEGEANAHPA
jgi:hypothetical protein